MIVGMADEPRSGRRPTRALAAGLFGLAMAGLVTGVACALAAGMSFADAVGTFIVTNGAMGLAFPACGALLAWHRPRNPIGWLFLAAGVGEAASVAGVALFALGARLGWPYGALRLLGSVFAYGWPLSIGLFLPLALLLFPDGRPLGPRWRWVVRAAVVEGVLFEAMAASPAPGTYFGVTGTLYLTIPVYGQLGPLWAATNIGWLAIAAAAIGSLVVRYRRGGDAERRQLLWLVLAVLAVAAYAGIPWGIFNTGPILGLLLIPLIPVAITIAILRYQLLDIRLVVSRALVYGILTAAAAGAYVGVVALLDALVRSRVSLGSAVIASIVIAVGFNPARVRLQRLIDRALYGDRRDPVRAVSLVGERLAGTGAAGLGGVLETLCESLRLPFAAVRFGSAETAAHGAMPELLHSTGLSYDGAHIGELVVGLRSGQRRLGSADIAVLELLAGPLAVALHATVLSAALQESRISLVSAREEERRRLRRDLHDGLGPALTGIAFKADAARNTVAAEPARAAALLAEMRADTTAAIADIRRLVYDLRPPALDDLGLVGAVREQSGRLAQRPDGGVVAVQISAPAELPPLPAAVEVAAYRIITEAMTNAARHSGARRVDVTLALTGRDLLIEVRDGGAWGDEAGHDGPSHDGALADATASTAEWSAGVGLMSMRDRAAELGGWCQAGPGPGGGLVTASLPLASATAVARNELSVP